MELKQLAEAIEEIAEEKHIDKKIIKETIEMALAAAYRKDYGSEDQNIVADFDQKTGKVKLFDSKEVVKELDEEQEKRPHQFVLLADAKKEKKGTKEGDVIRKELEVKSHYATHSRS